MFLQPFFKRRMIGSPSCLAPAVPMICLALDLPSERDKTNCIVEGREAIVLFGSKLQLALLQPIAFVLETTKVFH